MRRTGGWGGAYLGQELPGPTPSNQNGARVLSAGLGGGWKEELRQGWPWYPTGPAEEGAQGALASDRVLKKEGRVQGRSLANYLLLRVFGQRLGTPPETQRFLRPETAQKMGAQWDLPREGFLGRGMKDGPRSPPQGRRPGLGVAVI